MGGGSEVCGWATLAKDYSEISDKDPPRKGNVPFP